jgi:enoyl ACP reductase
MAAHPTSVTNGASYVTTTFGAEPSGSTAARARARNVGRLVPIGGNMGLLDGKRLLITGVLTEASLGYGVARLAQEEGAEIVLTGVGNGMKHTLKTARKLPSEPDVLEFDVLEPAHVDSVRSALEQRWDRVDGALHSIGFAPSVCLGGNFMDAGWDDVAVAMNASAYSLKTLADVVTPLMTDGGSIVGLDFDNTVSWPAYDWMGVAKSALESTSRYLARYLGPRQIRVNLVAAGPVKTIAARSIPGFSKFEDVWDDRAPLGWDVKDNSGVAKACVALLSDWFPQTTGEIVHVDGGYHTTGA